MTDHAKAAGLLLEWYRLHARDLPWRRTQDPWAIWVSEIMLQQTRVEAVIPKWLAFRQKFPRVEDFAEASEGQVLQSWSGLGYYRRVRMLHRAAQQVVQERGGLFPTSRDEWQSLPGVGAYTSAALASILGGEKVAVVDGNVKRVAARLLGLEFRADQTALHRAALVWAQGLQDHTRDAGDLNQALMEWGATVCLPRQPRCGACPLSSSCSALASGMPERLPLPAKRRAWKQVRIAFFLAQEEGKVWLEPSTLGWTPGYWEPPSLLLPEDAPPAEVWSAQGGRGQVLSQVGEFRHTITHHKIQGLVFPLLGALGVDYRSPASLPLSGLGQKSLKSSKKSFSARV